MKKLLRTTYLIIGIASAAWLVSCGDDDGDNGGGSNGQNAVSFDGNDFEISGGVLYDYGAVNYTDDSFDPLHWNYDFVVYDGTFSSANETFSGNFFVYAELLSPGTSGFQAGTFNFSSSFETADLEGNFYFNFANLGYDANGNNTVDDDVDAFYDATGGSIEVIDNGNNNYTINYNLQVVRLDASTGAPVSGESPVSLSFSAQADFEFIDETNGRIAPKGSRIFRK